MTPDRLAKIRALAEDERGNANVRAIAQKILAKHEKAPPRRRAPDGPVPGIMPSEDQERWVFMQLDQWHHNAKGNYVHSLTWKGRRYRFVLFKFKRTQNWGWLRFDILADTESWGRNQFADLREAHESAWLHLTLL